MTKQKTLEDEAMPVRARPHEVDQLLTDDLVRDCARRHGLLDAVEIALFAKGVRAAAWELVGDVPDHVIRAEVERLRIAAKTRDINKTCELLQCISLQTKSMLNGRRLLIADYGGKPSFNIPGAPAGPAPHSVMGSRSTRHRGDNKQMRQVSLPSPDLIRSRSSREEGFRAILALTTQGVEVVQGRKRGQGSRSTTRKQRLFAPLGIRPGRPTNDAAWEAAAFLRIAYLIAHEEGREPPRTANHNFPSGFAQFFQEILWHLGIPPSEINAVEAILNYDRRRKQLEKQRPSRPAK